MNREKYCGFRTNENFCRNKENLRQFYRTNKWFCEKHLEYMRKMDELKKVRTGILTLILYEQSKLSLEDFIKQERNEMEKLTQEILEIQKK